MSICYFKIPTKVVSEMKGFADQIEMALCPRWVGVDLAPGGRRACASWVKPAAMASSSSTMGSLLLPFTWSSRQNNFVIKKLPWLPLWLPWLQPSPPFPHLALSYHCHKIFRRIEEWLVIIPKCCVDRKPALLTKCDKDFRYCMLDKRTSWL